MILPGFPLDTNNSLIMIEKIRVSKRVAHDASIQGMK